VPFTPEENVYEEGLSFVFSLQSTRSSEDQ
jgi:hypothetical protein